MIGPSVSIDRAAVLSHLQETFVSRILPRVEAIGRVFFRQVRCRHHKAELLAEMAALSWRWFVRLVRRGKAVLHFGSALARFAARAIQSGRRLCGHEKSQDAMSGFAQRNRGFTVGTLPNVATLAASPLAEAIRDNTTTPIPDQVAFRLDFRAWRGTRSVRDRRMIDCMMTGESTAMLARLFGVSAARISQLRREFHDDWHAFCGELTGQLD
jgi:hypothetical protein